MIVKHILQTLILMDQTTRGFDKSLFKDPEKFNPDRWSREEDKPHPFSVLPFGYGQRNCFGKQNSNEYIKNYYNFFYY